MARAGDDAKLWNARIDAAMAVYKRVQEKHRRLEMALAGEFPILVPSGRNVGGGTTGATPSEQIETNILLWVHDYYKALCYDDMASVRFSRKAGIEEAMVVHLERATEQVMDDGNFLSAASQGQSSSFTRGTSVLWADLGPGIPSLANTMGTRNAAAQVAFAASQGVPVQIGPGMNYLAISEACRALLSPKRPDGSPNELRFTYTEEQVTNLERVAQDADKAYKDELDGPHPTWGTKGRICYQATPLGTWCLFDPTALTKDGIGWVARLRVFTYDELMACDAFKADAKRELEPTRPDVSGGAERVAYISMAPEWEAKENGRYRVWEIWDKRGWKLHYVVANYDGFLEKDSRYPYFNENGQPLFPDFFPCDICTPITTPLEDPTSTFGVPLLSLILSKQYEYIKTQSAYLRACKSARRTTAVSPGVDDETFNSIRDAEDDTFFRLPANYDATKHGPAFLQSQTMQAPLDYMRANDKIRMEAALDARIAISSLTSQPVAETGMQEEIALRGTTAHQTAFVAQYEAHGARMAQKTVALMSLLPDEVLAPYVHPIPAQVARALLLRLSMQKISMRFAAGTRAESSVRNKQLMDFLVAANGIRSPLTNMPIKDPKPLLERIAKDMDIGEMPDWKPSPEEIQMMQAMQAMQPQQGEGGEGSGPPGKRTDDSRLAGGRRGQNPIPDRQGRGRGPQDSSNAHGVQNRAASALA
jgi:hypothetical protein